MRDGVTDGYTELRGCVKFEVAVPNKPTVSVDVKHHGGGGGGGYSGWMQR